MGHPEFGGVLRETLEEIVTNSVRAQYSQIFTMSVSGTDLLILVYAAVLLISLMTIIKIYKLPSSIFMLGAFSKFLWCCVLLSLLYSAPICVPLFPLIFFRWYVPKLRGWR
jgi:hypothetical protein